VERTLAREHHAYPASTTKRKLALVRTLAREHHAIPAATGQPATSGQPAESSRTRPLLVVAVVGAASLIVALVAAVSLLRLRGSPREAAT
jgi:hypothetical protein